MADSISKKQSKATSENETIRTKMVDSSGKPSRKSARLLNFQTEATIATHSMTRRSQDLKVSLDIEKENTGTKRKTPTQARPSENPEMKNTSLPVADNRRSSKRLIAIRGRARRKLDSAVQASLLTFVLSSSSDESDKSTHFSPLYDDQSNTLPEPDLTKLRQKTSQASKRLVMPSQIHTPTESTEVQNTDKRSRAIGRAHRHRAHGKQARLSAAPYRARPPSALPRVSVLRSSTPKPGIRIVDFGADAPPLSPIPGPSFWDHDLNNKGFSAEEADPSSDHQVYYTESRELLTDSDSEM